MFFTLEEHTSINFQRDSSLEEADNANTIEMSQCDNQGDKSAVRGFIFKNGFPNRIRIAVIKALRLSVSNNRSGVWDMAKLITDELAIDSLLMPVVPFIEYKIGNDINPSAPILFTILNRLEVPEGAITVNLPSDDKPG
jgi:hypothetical protein